MGLAALLVCLKEGLVAALEHIGLRVPHGGVAILVHLAVALAQMAVGARTTLRRELAVEDDDGVLLLKRHEKLVNEILVRKVDCAAHVTSLVLEGEAAVDNVCGSVNTCLSNQENQNTTKIGNWLIRRPKQEANFGTNGLKGGKSAEKRTAAVVHVDILPVH